MIDGHKDEVPVATRHDIDGQQPTGMNHFPSNDRCIQFM